MHDSVAPGALLSLSHEPGEENRGLAVRGEGNTSARLDADTFLVEASGSSLGTLGEIDVVRRRAAAPSIYERRCPRAGQLSRRLRPRRVERPGDPGLLRGGPETHHRGGPPFSQRSPPRGGHVALERAGPLPGDPHQPAPGRREGSRHRQRLGRFLGGWITPWWATTPASRCSPRRGATATAARTPGSPNC